MITKEQIQEVTKVIVDTVHPQKVYMFGSYAKGTATEDSDLDLLVVVKDSVLPKRKRTIPIYMSFFKMKATVNTDILVRTEAELREWENVPQAFMTSILPTAKLIYER